MNNDKVGRIEFGPEKTMRETAFGFNKVQATSDTPRTFASGSVRDAREGKGRFDLVSPIAMKRLAQHYENGAKKYQDRNWEKGQPVMSYLDSAERHLNTLKEMKLKGLPLDEDHLSAIMWNIGAIIHVEEMVRCGLLPTELLDYPGPQPRVEGMSYNDQRNVTRGVEAKEVDDWSAYDRVPLLRTATEDILGHKRYPCSCTEAQECGACMEEPKLDGRN